MKSLNSLVNNPKFVKKVQYVLIALFLLVVALDVYLALDKEDGNTISNVIQLKTDNGLFILTYFWGAIAANLFFIRFKEPYINGIIGSIIVIGIALLFAIFNIEMKIKQLLNIAEYDFLTYALSMLFGLCVGLIFWRQHETKII
ncbi:hypothetical protein U0L90_07395 [Flavobacteriaceae sp. LMIT009]